MERSNYFMNVIIKTQLSFILKAKNDQPRKFCMHAFLDPFLDGILQLRIMRRKKITSTWSQDGSLHAKLLARVLPHHSSSCTSSSSSPSLSSLVSASESSPSTSSVSSSSSASEPAASSLVSCSDQNTKSQERVMKCQKERKQDAAF